MTVEINVVAGDANDCAVWSAVENGIEAVSGHSTIQVRPALSKPLMSDRRILSDAYFPTSRCARCGMPQKFGTLLSRVVLARDPHHRHAPRFGFTPPLIFPYDELDFAAQAFGLGCARTA